MRNLCCLLSVLGMCFCLRRVHPLHRDRLKDIFTRKKKPKGRKKSSPFWMNSTLRQKDSKEEERNGKDAGCHAALGR